MANLPHGKHANHLGVMMDATPTAPHGLGYFTVSLLDPMQVANPPTYTGWGILLSPHGKPGEGMHLFPDGAEFLYPLLRDFGVLNPTHAIAIEHTVNGPKVVWKVITAEESVRTALMIEEIVKGQA